MSLDDELRRALDDAAPRPVDPRPVRAELRPTLRRARSRQRLRTAATSGAVAVVLIGGTVALLAGGNRGGDGSQLGPFAGDGVATTTEPPTSTIAVDTASTTIVDPGPTTTVVLGPPTTDPTAPTTAPPATATTTTPASTPTTTPPTTTEAVPSTTTTTPPPGAGQSRQETPCGAVTFVYDATTITVTDLTDQPGYTGVVDRDSPTRVEVEWYEVGGGDEEVCKARAELEDGIVEFDTEP